MILTALLAAVASVLALPVLSDLVSVVRAVVRPLPRREAAHGATPGLLFLVPAHDEEVLVSRCVSSVLSLEYPREACRIVVVADNCTDRTAEVARAAGAEVMVRSDPDLRGKPAALAWALERLDLSAVEGVVILDADSRLAADYAHALAAAAPLGHKLVQGYNDVSNPAESSLTRMATVFSAARAIFMNGLKQRAGLTIPPANGFCYGARILESRGWREFSIVEDWEIYARLTAEGYPLENRPGARVFSQEARSMRQSAAQRRRWTAGKLEVLVREAAPILRSRSIGPRQKLDAMAELTAPGPVIVACIALVGSVTALWSSGPWAVPVALVFAAPVARICVYTVLGITRVDEPAQTAAAFLTLPVYAVSRLAIQFWAISTVGRRAWTRTSRHHEPEAEEDDHTPSTSGGVSGE